MLKGSIPALITPFLKNGSLDIESFAALVERQVNSNTAAIVIGGTTGESPTLSQEEYDVLVSIAHSICKGKLSVIVGTGTNCTATSVFRTKRAKELGADMVLVIVPYYNKPMDEGIYLHYKAIDLIGIPQIVYHHPGRCGRELSSEMLVRLSSLDTVIGIKETRSNMSAVKELIEKLDVAILCGDDIALLDYLEAGSTGTISVMANAFPTAWGDIVDLYRSGEALKAKEIFKEYQELMRATFLEVNPQGIKCLMALEKYCTNILRLPLIPCTKSTENQIALALQGLEKALV